jgi:hypothetical protein
MSADQSRQNPDVNNFNIGGEGDEDDNTNDSGGTASEEIPLPPDTQPNAPVEEPPGSDGSPVGDVDDSPKRIA